MPMPVSRVTMIRELACRLPLLFLIAIAGRPAGAQSGVPPDILDMNLDDLMKVEIDSVFGASGYKQNVNDTPASITIVTGDEIRRYGYRTLADVLAGVPGFYVTSDRAASYIGVRGFGPPGDYNSRILVLVDGHRLSEPVTGAAPVGHELPIDVALIDRVEVIRGPNSSVYTASALLSIVNVVTRKARDAQGLTVSAERASYGDYSGRLTFGNQSRNGLGILLSGTFLESHGPSRLYFQEFDDPAENYGVAVDGDGTRSYKSLAKVTWRGLALEASYGIFDQGNPTAPYGTIFNDAAQHIRLAGGYVNLSYDHGFGGDWGYTWRLYYDNDRYHGIYPFDESFMGGAPYVINQDLSQGQDVGAAFSVSKKLGASQTLVAGAELRDNFQEHQWNYDAQPYALYFDGLTQSRVFGVHLQDEIPIRRDLILDLGLSYDYYSTFGGTANPHAALIYQPREGATLKLLYGQSFRAPTPFELYYAVPGQLANPNLKPERARTSEIVFEQSLAAGFRLTASGYYYPIRNVISAGTDAATGSIEYQNGQRVDLKGVELAVMKQSSSGWEAGVGISVEHASNLGGPAPLTNSPTTLGQANLSVPLLHRRIFASANLQYVGRRLTAAGGSATAYVVPNFTLSSRRAFGGWDFSASIYNAFDARYGDPASVAHRQQVIYRDGRNARIQWTYHF